MMTDSPYEFEFLSEARCNEDSIDHYTLESLQQDGPWSSSRTSRALRVTSDHGTVVILARYTTVQVSVQNPNTILVRPPDDVIDGVGVAGVGVNGPMHVSIDTATSVLEAFEGPSRDQPRVPRIDITHRAVVRDFVGVASVSRLEGQLNSTGETKPGRLIGITQHVVGGKLTGVDITGLRDLEPLSKLSVCSPDIESLYDLASRYDRMACKLRKVSRGDRFRSAENELSTPRELAHWFRDLYGAIRSMAVPASTRSAVRWCYALLEHEAIKPRRLPQPDRTVLPERRLRETVESVGRWLHRCVGYGQRPSRAFACWMVTSGAVLLWSAQHRPVKEGTEWIKRFLEVALSTPGVLRLASSDAKSLVHAGYEPVAYLLVGLPFIFFVISLREFFRSPLNPRSSS